VPGECLTLSICITILDTDRNPVSKVGEILIITDTSGRAKPLQTGGQELRWDSDPSLRLKKGFRYLLLRLIIAKTQHYFHVLGLGIFEFFFIHKKKLRIRLEDR
jgi:hypothetical protein